MNRKRIYAGAAAALLLLFTACKMMGPESGAVPEGKAAALIGIEGAGIPGRTVFPAVVLADVTSWKLLGGKTTEAQEPLKDFANPTGQTLYLETGTWDFTLEGFNNDDVILRGNLTNQNITLEGSNSLVFTVKPVLDGNGTFKITINLPGGHGITEAKVFKDGTDIGTPVTPVLDAIIFEENTYPAGDYYFSFRLYKGNDLYGVVSELAQVRKDLRSEKTYTLSLEDLNISYVITYVLNGGLFGGGVDNPGHYRSTDADFTLPVPTRTGHAFGGWYNNSGFSGNAVTVISQGDTGDKEFYAKWTVLYTVSGTITTNVPGGPANGASVQLKQGATSVESPVNTDVSGAYIIPDVPAGTGYTIEVSVSGYATGTIPSFNVTGNVTGKDLTLVKLTAGAKTTYSGDSISFAMAWVPGGVTFPTVISDVVSATVTAAYEIGETAVTYELWYAVRSWAEGNGYTFYGNPGREGSGTNGGSPTGANQEPVTDVTWYDAVVWLNALTEWVNAKEGKSLTPVYYYESGCINVAKNSDPSSNFVKEDGSYTNASAYEKTGATGFRLPTSNEWELAARWRGSDATNTVVSGGYTNPYFTKGNSASGAVMDYNDAPATGDVAWYDGNSDSVTGISKTQPVKRKTANALGLYDMSGNVYEWCFEWFSSYDGLYRFRRGGSWDRSAFYLQVGSIGYGNSDLGSTNGGFRPVRTAQ